MQTSVNGVDPRTGRTLAGQTGGMISGAAAQILEQRLQKQGRKTQGEPLMPVYDGSGGVIAYERSMAPERLSALAANTHLGEMIGAWAGRHVEEAAAAAFNQALIDQMNQHWVADKRAGRAAGYVNLADANLNDPVLRDAWKMIPAETRAYAYKVFGPNMFPVRKDLINNTVGYREGSVGDLWADMSRLPKPAQQAFMDTATFFMGTKALRNLAVAEQGWKTGVAVAKSTIVVKSVVVPLANLASNFLQLMSHGVPIRHISKGMTAKLVEIDQHLRNLQRNVEIEALKARHHKDPVMLRKLEVEQKSL